MEVANSGRNENVQLLTMDDLENNGPVRYDAMVLFAEANQAFVDGIAKRMKAKGFRLFTDYRNNLAPGEMPHSLVCELIASRCHNIIVVYSPEFFNGGNDDRRDEDEVKREVNDNQYYAAYALATKIASKGGHRMIPCVYEKCALPVPYRHDFMLYVESDAYDFYERLANVLGTPPKPSSPAPRPAPNVPMITSRRRRPRRNPMQIIRHWCGNISNRFSLRRPQTVRAQ